MSIIASKWAWSVPDLTAGQKLVLLALADKADDKGGRCFPSIDTLEAMTGLRRRSVTRSLADLEQRELISRDRSGGRIVTRYNLAVDTPQQGPDVPVQQGPDVPVTEINRDLTSLQQGPDVPQQGPDVPLSISSHQRTTTTPVSPGLSPRARQLAEKAGRNHASTQAAIGRIDHPIAISKHKRNELIRERADLLEAYAARDDIDDDDAIRGILRDQDPPKPKKEHGWQPTWPPDPNNPAPEWTPEPMVTPQRGPAEVWSELGGRAAEMIRTNKNPLADVIATIDDHLSTTGDA